MGGIDSIGAQGAGGAQPTETTNETSPMTPKGTADKAQRTETTHTDSLARSDSIDELSGGASGKDDFAEIDDALASGVQPSSSGKVEGSSNPWFTVSFAAEFFEVMSKLTTLLKEMKLDDSKTLVMCQKLMFEMKQLEADFVKEASTLEASKHYTAAIASASSGVVSLATAALSVVISFVSLGATRKVAKNKGAEAPEVVSAKISTINQFTQGLNQGVSKTGEATTQFIGTISEVVKGTIELEKGSVDSERTRLQGLEQAWEQFTQSMRGQLDTGKSETQAAFKLLEETLAKIMQQSAFRS